MKTESGNNSKIYNLLSETQILPKYNIWALIFLQAF